MKAVWLAGAICSGMAGLTWGQVYNSGDTTYPLLTGNVTWDVPASVGATTSSNILSLDENAVLAGQSLVVGGTGASNRFNFRKGASATLSSLIVGQSIGGSENVVNLLDTASLTVAGNVTVGGTGNMYNSLTVQGGSTLSASSVAVGDRSSLALISSTLEIPALSSLVALSGGGVLAGVHLSNNSVIRVTSEGTVGASNSLNIISDQGTSTIDVASSLTFVLSGGIGGVGDMRKTGGGTLTLSSFSLQGSFSIDEGLVVLKNAESSIVPLRASSLAIAGELQLDYFKGVTCTATLSGAGTMSSFAGDNVMSGASTFTGQTEITGGSLTFAKKSSLYGGNAANWTGSKITVGSGATLALGVGGAGEFTLADIQTIMDANHLGGGGLSEGARLGMDTTNAAGGVFEFSDNLSDTINGAIGLTKLGTNTLRLTGTNTYTGGTLVRNGWVSAASTANLGTGPLVLETGATGGFIYEGAFTLPEIRLGETGGTLNTNGFDVALGRDIIASGVFSKSGLGTLALPASVSASSLGSMQVSGGVLKIQGGISGAGTLTVAGGAGTSLDLDGGNLVRTGVTVGATNLTNNSITVRNGGQLSSASITLGGIGTANTDHSVLITGHNASGLASSWSTTGNIQIGGVGNNNTLTVTDGGRLNSTGAILYVGQRSASSGNRLIVSNKGVVTHTGSLNLGAGSANAKNNSLVVTGEGSVVSIDGGIYLGGSTSALSTGNVIEIDDFGLLLAGDSESDAFTIYTGNYVRLNGGYLALCGDRTEVIDMLLSNQSFQIKEGGSWITATRDDLDYAYFASDESAAVFTGGKYTDLGGYTIVTSIPEPSTWALLGLGASVVFFATRRSFVG